MSLHIAYWNLENLFAPEGHPDRLPRLSRRMASDLDGWTPQLFERKLDQLSTVIAAMNAGMELSQGFRATAGETLGYWHERIREEKGNDVVVVAGGDFNDDPFDPSLTLHANATRERGDVERARSARFYNLAWHYLEQEGTNRDGEKRLLHGTLHFRGDGNVFDQVLVSPGALKANSPLRVLEDSARIEAFPAAVDGGVSPAPRRFGLPKGDAAQDVDTDGYSDHFPVSVLLEERWVSDDADETPPLGAGPQKGDGCWVAGRPAGWTSDCCLDPAIPRLSDVAEKRDASA